jgi:hypothetical protein
MSSRSQYKVTLDEKTHIYHVMNKITGESLEGKIYTISQIASKIYSEFNPKTALQRMSQTTKDERYKGLSDEQILDIWKSNGRWTAMLGIKLHAYIEHYLKGECLPIPEPIPSPVMTFDDSGGVVLTEAHFQELKDYIESAHLKPFSIEKPVFNRELMIAGTYDTIFINEKNQYILVDYKRRKELTSDNYRKGVIQLNLYRILWELQENKQITKMFIVSIFPTNTHIDISEIEIRDVLPKVMEFLEKERIKEDGVLTKTASSSLGVVPLSLC